VNNDPVGDNQIPVHPEMAEGPESGTDEPGRNATGGEVTTALPVMPYDGPRQVETGITQKTKVPQRELFLIIEDVDNHRSSGLPSEFRNNYTVYRMEKTIAW